MKKRKSPHVGTQTYRLKDNPEEKRFADAWREQNERARTLDYLFTEPNALAATGVPVVAPDNICEMAATVIQWLGSPVGQAFLRELQYANVDELKAEHLGYLAEKNKQIAALKKIAISGWESARCLAVLDGHRATEKRAISEIEKLEKL